MRNKITWIFIAILFIGFVDAQTPSFQLENRVGSESFAFISLLNISKAQEAFKTTEFWKLIQEEEVRSFVKELIAPHTYDIKKALKKIEKELQIDLEELVKAFHGEISFAVVRNAAPKAKIPVALFLSIQYGPHRKVVEHFLNLLKEKQAQENFKLEEHQKGKYRIYILRKATPPEATPCFAILEDTVVFSSNEFMLYQVLQKNLTPLSSNISFLKAKQKTLRQNPVSFVYINVLSLYKHFGRMIPEPAPSFLKQLGLWNVKSLSYGFSFDHGYFHNAAFMEIEGARKGITELLDFPPASIDSLKYVPFDATQYAASNFDLENFFADFEKVLQEADKIHPGLKLFEKYTQGQKQLEQMLGFSIKKFACSLTGEFCMFQYLPKNGGLIPHSIGMAKIKDIEVLKAGFEKFANFLQLDIKVITYKNKKIYYLSVPLGKLGRNPFKHLKRMRDPIEGFKKILGYFVSGTGLFFEEDMLFHSQNVYYLKNFIDDRAEWKKSLQHSPRFQKVYKWVDPQSSFFFYQDSPKLFNAWWNTLTPALRFVEGIARDTGINFDTALLPQAKTISKHLFPATMNYASNKDGIVIESRSTTGDVIYMVPVTGIVAAIAIPGLLRARLSANEAAAMGTLRAFSSAQASFKACTVVDQDQDGTGEYGFIGELSGAYPLRGSGKRANPVYTARFHFDKNGIASKSGYYFYCYLPGKNKAIGEKDWNTKVDDDAINNQENRYVIYAWPIKPGNTGRRVFAIDQSGEVYQCNYKYINWLLLPAPETAYSRRGSGNKKNLEGYLGGGHVGYWRPAR